MSAISPLRVEEVRAALEVLVAKPGLEVTIELLIWECEVYPPAVREISRALAAAARNFRVKQRRALDAELAKQEEEDENA